MSEYNERYDKAKGAPAGQQDILKDSYELLDRLERMVLQAKSMPFSNNCILSREEALVSIGLLRDGLPVELKQAKWLLDQSHEILDTARERANAIVEDAQDHVQHLIDQHEITQQARHYAEDTVNEANEEARQIREAALVYTEKRLSQVEDQLTEILVTVRKHKKELQG